MTVFAIPHIGGYDGPLWLLLLVYLVAFGVGVPLLMWLFDKMGW